LTIPRLAWLSAALMTMLLALAPSARANPAAGQVRFMKGAEASFDSHLLNPTPTAKNWMSDHYWRMRAYAPFFDSRLSWYPKAWAYKDSYAIYRGQEAGQEQWILKDRQGRRLYIPFACSGGSCTQYAADVGDPGWRRRWIDDAKALIAKGYRGIFVDDVNLAFKVSDGSGAFVAPIDRRTGAEMTHESWQRYFAEFMEQLRAELPAGAEIVHNQVYFHVGLTSPFVRRAIDAATHIEFERGFNDTGIRGGGGKYGYDTVAAWVDYAHSKGKGVIYDVQADWGREYALANYFLFGNGADGIGMDQGGLPDDWWPGWQTDLGAPLGDRYEWSGVQRRDFERGTVLVNPPDGPTRTLALGGDWASLDGHARSGVTLAGREGVVLLRRGELTVTLEPAPTPQAASVTPAPTPQTPPAAASVTFAPTAGATPKACRLKRCRRASVSVALDARASARFRHARARRAAALLRGSVRGEIARRAHVSLQRRTRRGWIRLRRVTTVVDRRGRFRVVFDNLPAGTYRAGVRLPWRAHRPAAIARTAGVTLQP
jgi:hypothetical protein